jgi:hypothetical protein
MIVPKYVIILLIFSIFNFNIHSNIMVVHRKTSVSGQPKPTSTQVTAHKATAVMAATAASSSAGGTGWTILSTADAWDSSWRVTEFLEGLKNREADQEGIPFALLAAFIH